MMRAGRCNRWHLLRARQLHAVSRSREAGRSASILARPLLAPQQGRRELFPGPPIAVMPISGLIQRSQGYSENRGLGLRSFAQARPYFAWPLRYAVADPRLWDWLRVHMKNRRSQLLGLRWGVVFFLSTIPIGQT